MASIYKRSGSRFWWLRIKEANGHYGGESTGIDHRLPGSRKQALKLAAARTIREINSPKVRESERWDSWALPYLDRRYAKTGSLASVLLAWRDIQAFFRERKILTPRQVSYSVAAEFIPWRVATKDHTKIKVNTAKLRFVYFSVLMGEAVRRGLAEFNPCRDVKVRADPPKEKQEITTEHQRIIEQALATAPERMQDEWLFMMHQGCRIAETAVPMERIDTQQMMVTLRLKGERMHTQKLHPKLLPLIARARERKDQVLIDMRHSDTTRWCQFFRKLKMPYSSHCCRVTVITRLLRKGHSAALVSAFVGHTEEVNRICRRLKPADSALLLDTLGEVSNPL